jgi:predicted dehydrogenase
MASAPLRFGVVGLGMGKAHAKALLGLPGIELTAIAEPRAERFEQLRQEVVNRHPERSSKLDAITRYDSYQEMIKAGAVDAVSLALPTDIHFEATAWCLKRDIHVVCEKPPTTDGGQMKKLWKLAQQRGLAYAFVRQQRFQPKVFAARELATKGKLGVISHAESHWLRSRGIPWREGWGVNKDAGGGVLLDLGIHKVDDAWLCMGNPDPESVFCGMHCAFSHLADKRTDLTMDYNADDATIGMIRFAGGATLSMSVSFAMNRVKAVDYDQDGVVERSEWQELAVYGNKAGVDVSRAKLVKNHAKGVTVGDLPIPKRLENMRTGFEGLFADFAKAVRDERPPLNDARQALQLMRMLDALKKSAETGRSVSLPPLD